MTPLPFNLSVLKSDDFLKVDQSGSALVTEAGTAKADWRFLAGKIGTIGKHTLVRSLVIGGVTVEYAPGWVTMKSSAGGQWGVNAGRFAGNPKLEVKASPSGDDVTITLKEARFPGFDIPAVLTAHITLAAGKAKIDLKFDCCGFAATVDLADWLDGKAIAVAPVFFDDEVCRVTDGMHLRLAGATWAVFFPSWIFSFGGGQAFVDLTTQGDTISSKVLALALLGPGIPSLLPNPANRRSMLFIPEKEAFDVPLWPEKSSGWRFFHQMPAFLRLSIEADEQLDGSVRRAVTAVGSTSTGLFFQPGADLLNDYMLPFSIPLQKPVYVAVYRGDGTRLGATLVALRTAVPLTAHAPGCSLALGPMPRKPGFMLLDIPPADGNPGLLYLGPIPSGSAPLLQGLPFSLLATAPRLGDFVVDPMPPLAASTMFLSIAPIVRTLKAGEGVVDVSGDAPEARIVLPDWILTQVVRPRDLMVLGLQFLGLRPEFRGSGPGKLARIADDVPRIVVYFPPQSIGEQAFIEDLTTTSDSVPPTMINYRSAGLSRLAFDLPDDAESIPYIADVLLDWKGTLLKPRLDGRAITPDAPTPVHVTPVTPVMKPYRAGLKKARLADGWLIPSFEQVGLFFNFAPDADATAIEAPYRLLISPDQYGYWDTAVSTVMASGPRAVLWHARLAGPPPAADVPQVRAIWSIDKSKGVSPDPFVPPVQTDKTRTESLTPGDRDFIVSNSALKSVDANRLMLTSLGAWMNLDGNWTQLDETKVTLERWLHRSTMGRDQFVQVVKRGYLYPFGHKAVLIEITERKFGQNPPGRRGAWLRKRAFIVVKEYERDYMADQAGHGVFEHQGREIPFRSVRVLTRVTPLLDQTYPGVIPIPPAEQEAAFWPTVNYSDYLFSLNATDKAGRMVEFSAPLAFVRNDITFKKENVDLVVADQADPTKPDGRRNYRFGGQGIFFADTKGGKDEALEAMSIGFEGFFRLKKSGEAWARPFYPKMKTAEVVAPAMRQFAGTDTASSISYFNKYLENGFGGPNSQGEVYARFTDGVTVDYGGGNRTDKVGGMITPSMLAGGISRAHGIVGSGSSGSIETDLADFGKGTFNPLAFFSGDAPKILGGISLASILEEITGFASGGDLKIPQWVSDVTDKGELKRSFTWKSDQLKADAGSFASGASRGIEITCEVTVGAASGANATVTASLVDFTITLAKVIEIPFNVFSMSMEAGRKPEVNVDIGKIKFVGALAFVSVIEDYLGLDRFVDPPSIDITAEGLSIGYGIQLPSIQVGVFALQNLALNASATLPFIGDPFRARFALSERQNPFMVSVSFFTGGGFFAIGVGLDGVEMLELSIEFGGNFSLDIGVASGGVHVMAGIYIKMSAKESDLTGYVRAGGSLCVLGLITVSVEFYLGLTYDFKNDKAWGEASMTVEIEILFFSVDVTLTVRREFAGGSADPTLADAFSLEEWDTYQAAFAS